eukprot:scaffold25475_cov153-Amphora_coffeaeformis.AAC.1
MRKRKKEAAKSFLNEVLHDHLPMLRTVPIDGVTRILSTIDRPLAKLPRHGRHFGSLLVETRFWYSFK